MDWEAPAWLAARAGVRRAQAGRAPGGTEAASAHVDTGSGHQNVGIINMCIFQLLEFL